MTSAQALDNLWGSPDSGQAFQHSSARQQKAHTLPRGSLGPYHLRTAFGREHCIRCCRYFREIPLRALHSKEMLRGSSSLFRDYSTDERIVSEFFRTQWDILALLTYLSSLSH